MISFLLEKGVDVHSREGGLSAFEVACFPEVDLSSRNFEMVLRYSSIEKASQGNDFFDGCSPLHLTAGFFGAQGSVWKLNRLVQFGLNCNFPVEATGKPPLLFISYTILSTQLRLFSNLVQTRGLQTTMDGTRR